MTRFLWCGPFSNGWRCSGGGGVLVLFRRGPGGRAVDALRGSREFGGFAWGVPVVVRGVVHTLGESRAFVFVVLGSLFGHSAHDKCAVAPRDRALFVTFATRPSVADMSGVVAVSGVDVLAFAIGASVGFVQIELELAFVLRGWERFGLAVVLLR